MRPGDGMGELVHREGFAVCPTDLASLGHLPTLRVRRETGAD